MQSTPARSAISNRIACRAAGIPADLNELTRRCKTDRHGTTLSQLRRAAIQKGFAAEAVHVDETFLQRALRSRPAAGIAWVNGLHYVTFFAEPSGVKVIDSPPATSTGRDSWSVAELAQRSQGYLLFLGWRGQPLPASVGAPTTPGNASTSTLGAIGKMEPRHDS